ncbi:MAG TPA: SigE family RNA polymerase sigma factor [Nocardioidaceae bacterium]|nr:SigE family RNA polymerase sigma factor [Nocardioidaceae bacterium]
MTDGRSGDRDEEFSLFVAERWPTLVRAARLIGCSASEAEDLVQSALVKCYVSWARVSRAVERDAYVYRLLLNTHRSGLRRRSSRETPTDLSRTAIAVAVDERTYLQTSVEAALGRLGAPARQIVVLRYYLDLSERQTAEILDIPAGTVKSRLSRALSQLSDDPALEGLPGWSPR